MKRLSVLGFTLIELLVVIVLIGIFCMLAIPGIQEIQYRNALGDTVERLRSAAGATRDLAMQTRHAAVLEVTADRAWINLLEGPDCGDRVQGAGGGPEKKCTTNLGDTIGEIHFGLGANDRATEAGVAMCGAAALRYDLHRDTPTTAPTCETAVRLSNRPFGLCYSGSGELFFRDGGDDNLGGCGDPNLIPSRPQDDWKPVCSKAAPDIVDFSGTRVAVTDGVAVLFNRYDAGSACTGLGIDVPRILVFPTNGSPFSIIAPSVEDPDAGS